MSLANTLSQKSYNGNGATTVFPTTFAFKANADVLVEVAQAPTFSVFATKVLGVDYTLSGAGAAEPGGSVTFISGAPPNPSIVRITRNTPLTQPTSFISQFEFLPEVHEAAFDREEMQVQELGRRVTVLETGASPVTLAASKVQNTFVAGDPAEGAPFPIAVACSGTPSMVLVGRVEDLTDGSLLQTGLGVPDVSVMAINSFTVRYLPGLTPGHQYRVTYLVLTL